MATSHPVTPWRLTILDVPTEVNRLGSLAAADLDGDGSIEVVVGGDGLPGRESALLWYRPATHERGVIAHVNCNVGLTIEDLDGDGRGEVVAGIEDPATGRWTITWFDPPPTLDDPWPSHVLDADAGGAHDVIFADVDGDGDRELVANGIHGQVGTYLYDRPESVTNAWPKHTVSEDVFLEGLQVADLTGDGRLELVHGPDLFVQPDDGPFSGPWHRETYAPSFREMCRTAVVDVTGNGLPDIVAAESEYLEGRLSWFENRTDLGTGWIEHPIDRPLYYTHSLDAWSTTDGVSIFAAEMAEGGWGAPYNYQARQLFYRTADAGVSWSTEPAFRGAGTHEATILHTPNGPAIAGKEWAHPKVQWWERADPTVQFEHWLLDRDKPGQAVQLLSADVTGDGTTDVVCGRWWYEHGTWTRRRIPALDQIVAAVDLDGDGRPELIGTRPSNRDATGYDRLSSRLVWCRPVEPRAGAWDIFDIGTGTGDWIHGATTGQFHDDERTSLAVAYHDGTQPSLFVPPADPTEPWDRSTLADIPYSEELTAHDVTGNGVLDIVGGNWWLENDGAASFEPHLIVDPDDYAAAGQALVDVTGTGNQDLVLGHHALDFETAEAPIVDFAWFERPADPRAAWTPHVIDSIRCTHSVGAGTFDGALTIVTAEHDPFYPYRNQCRMFAYTKAAADGTAWHRTQLDDRFEHHVGTTIADLGDAGRGVLSHGWTDTRYVHFYGMTR